MQSNTGIMRASTQETGYMGKRIAVLDDDVDVADLFAARYRKLGLIADAYHYPMDMTRFWVEAMNYDIILLDHRLGGTNGANVAANLWKNSDVRAKVFIFTSLFHEEYRSFKYYFRKDALIEDPTLIFTVEESIIDRAVETSVLRQMRVEDAVA